MSSQQYQPRRSPQVQPLETEQASLRSQAAKDAYDAVLDEIDAVLERDAEAYVKGFVQKGGQ